MLVDRPLAVSYTHLDVYKRQVLVGDLIAVARVVQLQHQAAVARNIAFGDTVSYTHLDVYKRQAPKGLSFGGFRYGFA